MNNRIFILYQLTCKYCTHRQPFGGKSLFCKEKWRCCLEHWAGGGAFRLWLWWFWPEPSDLRCTWWCSPSPDRQKTDGSVTPKTNRRQEVKLRPNTWNVPHTPAEDWCCRRRSSPPSWPCAPSPSGGGGPAVRSGSPSAFSPHWSPCVAVLCSWSPAAWRHCSERKRERWLNVKWLEKAQTSTKSRIYVKQHGCILKRFSVLYYFQIYLFGMTVTAAGLF